MHEVTTNSLALASLMNLLLPLVFFDGKSSLCACCCFAVLWKNLFDIMSKDY